MTRLSRCVTARKEQSVDRVGLCAGFRGSSNVKTPLEWFYKSRQRVLSAIRLLDAIILLGAALSGIGWWITKESWAIGQHTLAFVWHDHYLWWLALPLAARLAIAGGADKCSPQERLGLFRYRSIQRFAFVYAAVMIPLTAAEHLLKGTHIDIRLAPMVLATRHEGVERYHEDMLRDPELLWKFDPGSTVCGGHINALGFRDREVTPAKAPGVRRVICLGDSVTTQGQPCYARYLHQMLTNAPPDGGTWEAFSMGVYGYSSLQGLRLLETRVQALHPDVVTVSFGRNDHNLAKTTDQVRMAVRRSPFMAWVDSVLSRRVVGRLFLHAIDRRHQWTAIQTPNEVRVPPDDFRINMRLFVDEIRAMGAVPILITAPRRKIPESYVDNKYARTTTEFEQQHDAYAQIVRDVAQEKGAALLDLQHIMAGPECDTYFAADAVHFDSYATEDRIAPGSVDQPGLRRIATEIYKTIATLCASTPVKSTH